MHNAKCMLCVQNQDCGAVRHNPGAARDSLESCVCEELVFSCCLFRNRLLLPNCPWHSITRNETQFLRQGTAEQVSCGGQRTQLSPWSSDLLLRALHQLILLDIYFGAKHSSLGFSYYIVRYIKITFVVDFYFICKLLQVPF